jgi:hypothetical protein
MNPLRSLRDYVDRLKALGEIQEIDIEVDWHLELGAIIRRCYELKAPAPLFNRIKGIEAGFRVLGAPATPLPYPTQPSPTSLSWPTETSMYPRTRFSWNRLRRPLYSLLARSAQSGSGPPRATHA